MLKLNIEIPSSIEKLYNIYKINGKKLSIVGGIIRDYTIFYSYERPYYTL